MKIIIAGANGFIGRHLSRFYLDKGWEVIGIARRTDGLAEGVQFVKWDGKTLEDSWASLLDGADIVVNLTGRTVNCRYTDENKKQILESRTQSTRVIGQAIAQCAQPPKYWFNSSTATIFKDSYDEPQTDEDGEIGTGFSVEVAKAWEKELFEADLKQGSVGVSPAGNTESNNETRRIAIRISLVFANEPGTVYQVLRRLARLGLGGKAASGKQKVSWIHIDDFCRAIDHIYSNHSPSGGYNFAAPNPTDNAGMMKSIRKHSGGFIGKLIGLPAAKWMLEVGAFFMRTETELILKSRYVVPTKLQSQGFTFKHKHFDEMVNHFTETINQ